MYLTKLNTLSNVFDRLFEDFSHPLTTSSNFSEHFFSKNEKGYVLELLVPGMNKENLKVEIEDGMLKVFGEYKSSVNSYKVNRTYKLMEEIDISKINAEIKDGVLNVELPLVVEKKKTKKIELI